jgi:DNA-binding PadR family transcriptional regulator
LFILGTLARSGPMHGHQMRRAAQTDRTDIWSEVKPGALYQALHRMAQEGTIEAVRVEQEGNRPARTIYRITEEGRQELEVLRNVALRSFQLRPDPVDVALQNIDKMPQDQLRAILQDRRSLIATEHATWRHVYESAAPHLRPIEQAIINHSLRRLEAELQWHDELLSQLPTLLEVDSGSLRLA